MDQTPEINKIATLRELLIDELSDLYDAERQLLNILPNMVKASCNENLKSAFEEDVKKIKQSLARLEHIFVLLDAPGSSRRSRGMAGLINGEDERIHENAAPSVRDAALIGGAQKMQHYGIAGYGTLRPFADLLGSDEIAELLQQTLMDKFEMDRSLTHIASRINTDVASHGAN